MAKYPIPRPSELRLVDSKSNLEELKKNQPKVYLWRAVIGLLILVFCAICGILLFRDAQNVLNWFENLGPLGPVVFTLALSFAVVVMFPTPLIKVSAGAIFPFWIAAAANFVASLLGGLVAFLLGRWLFRESIQRSIMSDKRLQNIETALTVDAMKISVLVRLSPLIPDEWLNYLMSATPVSLRVYMVSNCSGIVYSLAYAYYGHALGRFALNSSGVEGMNSTPLGNAMLVLGIVASILATVLVTRASMKALQDAIPEQ
ncbi:MAG: VTT domain-containing protein [Candidatus Poseidoniaceae archaeon]|nr:VTT domain-containing protein [Candidatus Poseidoniaceae archaeon]